MRAERLAKGIYWGRSWNPFTGCTPIGDGCLNCWARRTAETRLRGRCGYPADEPFRPTFHPERLSQVNSSQRPKVIALCFMSDPFHEGHQSKDIIRMLNMIAVCPQHIFIALTKRPERMQRFLSYWSPSIPNLVGGVSVWDQESADRMIPVLLETNLATRIVSLEPLLGSVVLSIWDLDKIDGVILGGESGPGARPMHPDWARSVRDQCQAANVPLYFKQWGEFRESDEAINIVGDDEPIFRDCASWKINQRIERGAIQRLDNLTMVRIGKKAAGRHLDGREWNEMPEVIERIEIPKPLSWGNIEPKH